MLSWCTACYDWSMKYKIVGYANIFIAAIYALAQAGVLLFVYPRMMSMYESMGVELPKETSLSPVVSLIAIAVFSWVVYLGIKLVKKPSERLFWINVVLLICLLTISGLFFSASFLSLIIPMYTITSSLWLAGWGTVTMGLGIYSRPFLFWSSDSISLILFVSLGYRRIPITAKTATSNNSFMVIIIHVCGSGGLSTFGISGKQEIQPGCYSCFLAGTVGIEPTVRILEIRGLPLTDVPKSMPA